MNKILFLDLQRQYKEIKDQVDSAIQKVLERQYFILGEELEHFEKEFAAYLGAKYTVGVGSGTDGLILSLMALGIGPGDEVITPANSFIATTTAIVQVGAKPILVDVDPQTYQINVREVQKHITKRTKAILPVHLYGAPCDIQKLVEIAKRYKLYLIEDACQAHGATYKKKKMGTFGDIGVFSFYPGKNLGAYGDGGAISTNSKVLYEKVLKLRNYGQSKKYYHDKFGLNSRLDEIQAAVLRVKLRHLDKWNKKRNQVAFLYREKLQQIKTQEILENSVSCYHIFAIEVSNRDKVRGLLEKKGIYTLIHYPIPIHLQRCFRNLGYKKGDFPHTEKSAKRLISLPMYSELQPHEIDYIAEQIMMNIVK